MEILFVVVQCSRKSFIIVIIENIKHFEFLTKFPVTIIIIIEI